MVTDWEKPNELDYYFTDEWMKREGKDEEEIEAIRRHYNEGDLYEAYIVKALDYCVYYQMDADKVFIDGDMNVLLQAETAIIGNNHDKRIEYEI